MTDPKQWLKDSEQTGLTVSQVTDEVLYTGLVEMQELPELAEWGEDGMHWPHPSKHKGVSLQ